MLLEKRPLARHQRRGAFDEVARGGRRGHRDDPRPGHLGKAGGRGPVVGGMGLVDAPEGILGHAVGRAPRELHLVFADLHEAQMSLGAHLPGSEDEHVEPAPELRMLPGVLGVQGRLQRGKKLAPGHRAGHPGTTHGRENRSWRRDAGPGLLQKPGTRRPARVLASRHQHDALAAFDLDGGRGAGGVEHRGQPFVRRDAATILAEGVAGEHHRVATVEYQGHVGCLWRSGAGPRRRSPRRGCRGWGGCRVRCRAGRWTR